jgi:hypothetical protein
VDQLSRQAQWPADGRWLGRMITVRDECENDITDLGPISGETENTEADVEAEAVW